MSDTRTNTALPRELHGRLKMLLTIPPLAKKYSQIRHVNEEAIEQWMSRKKSFVQKNYPEFVNHIWPNNHATSSKQ